MKFPSSLIAVFAVLSITAPLATGGDYPRADLLVEPKALANEATKAFVVLDAREQKAFDEGHVPGAHRVDPAAWAKDFGDGGDANGWSRRIGGLGIGPESRVVVYDDNLAKDSARIWWILRYWGVKDARLLNGGWKGWIAGGHPKEKESQPFNPANFKAAPLADRIATKDELLNSLDGGTLQVVDARSEKEYCGLDEMKNKRAGALPGAKHLEWSDLLDKKSERFKPASDLQRLFADAGIDLARPVAAHCQSGGRASVMAFGLELMGAKHVKNYYRSWSEWGNASDTPIVRPSPKKKSAMSRARTNCEA